MNCLRRGVVLALRWHPRFAFVLRVSPLCGAASRTKCKTSLRICCSGHKCEHPGSEECGAIFAMKVEHKSAREIARALGRSPATISRELRRNAWKQDHERGPMGRPAIAGGYDANAGCRAARPVFSRAIAFISSMVWRLFMYAHWGHHRPALTLPGAASHSWSCSQRQRNDRAAPSRVFDRQSPPRSAAITRISSSATD